MFPWQQTKQDGIKKLALSGLAQAAMDPLSSNTDTQKLSLQTTEPSTTSDNKEERILARRQRIQTKMESDRRAALGEESPKVRHNEFISC